MPDTRSPVDFNGTGVRLLAAFPDDYEAIGVKSTLQNSKTGPCIVIYDRTVWNAWDAPFWVGNMRPAQPGDTSCKLCGQDIACLNGGPGVLAVWNGVTASNILDAFEVADDELLMSMAWHRFAMTAPLEVMSEYEGLADHIAGDNFRGFRKLSRAYGVGMEWMDNEYGRPYDQPEWAYSTFSRDRHLPLLLDMLVALGVRVPQSPALVDEHKHSSTLNMARAGAERIREHVAADRKKLMSELARASATSAVRWESLKRVLPDIPPPSPAEELAEALMGYDHAAGEARPWGPFSQRSMLGHNSAGAADKDEDS